MKELTVFIADDETDIREIIAQHIEKNEKYHVVGEASDGKSALSVIETTKPDIIITDICMPQLDGLGLIKQLRENNTNIPVIIISGYDDFAYAQSAISYGVEEYLLKPFLPEDLDKTLSKISEKIAKRLPEEQLREKEKNEFFTSILEKPMDTATIQTQLKRLGIYSKGFFYIIGFFRFYEISTEKPLKEEEEEKLYVFIKKHYHDYISCNGWTEIFTFKNKQRAIFCSFNGTGEEEWIVRLKEACNTISHFIQTTFGKQFWCGFSSCFTALSKAPIAAKQAQIAWQRNFDLSASCSFYQKNTIQNDELKAYEEAIKEEMILIQSKTLARDTTITADIDRLFHRLSQMLKIDANKTWIDIMHFLLQIVSIIQDKDTNESPYMLPQYLQSGDFSDSLFDSHKALLHDLSLYFSLNNHKGDKEVNTITSTVKKNISENIDNPTYCINDAAQGLNYSLSYIRHVFVQSEGCSIKKYVNKERIALARRLLKNPTIKIQDIAQKTGFENQRYFSRAFKKITGCTPSEYRERQDS